MKRDTAYLLLAFLMAAPVWFVQVEKIPPVAQAAWALGVIGLAVAAVRAKFWPRERK